MTMFMMMLNKKYPQELFQQSAGCCSSWIGVISGPQALKQFRYCINDFMASRRYHTRKTRWIPSGYRIAMNNQHIKWIKHHFLSSIHRPFSIAMLNNQRVVVVRNSRQKKKLHQASHFSGFSPIHIAATSPFVCWQHPHDAVGLLT